MIAALVLIGLGLGIGMASRAPDSAGGGPAPNPNLLLWTEEFDNAVWAATLAVVLPNAGTDPLATSTADLITNAGGSSAVRQISATAAATGAAATATVSAPTVWTRQSVTGIFDALPYTFSVYLRDGSGGGVPDVRLRIDRSGGFLRCSLEDGGDGAIYFAWGAQLEQAALASAYQKREGA